MAKQIKLAATTRASAGKTAVKQVRKQGRVPAVIYGAKQSALGLEIDRRSIESILSHAVGENLLVDLEIKEEKGGTINRLAIIQEVQHHPIRGDIMHVDFHAVSVDEVLHTEVPVEPVGEPVGVKTHGGILEQMLRSLEIECLPKDLPELIQVDVSNLNVGNAIHVRDIALPQGVKALNDPEVTVFLVAEPNVSVESTEGAAAGEPEVLKEKKADADAEKK